MVGSFQLTSSRRGWLQDLVECNIVYISTHILTKRMTSFRILDPFLIIFQLTSSRRGWRCSYFLELPCLYFNSHPHEEDDNPIRPYSFHQKYFNSHPHEEDDFLLSVIAFLITISTHILTKRMTIIVSIHRKMEVFQLTSSRRGWRISPIPLS